MASTYLIVKNDCVCKDCGSAVDLYGSDVEFCDYCYRCSNVKCVNNVGTDVADDDYVIWTVSK